MAAKDTEILARWVSTRGSLLREHQLQSWSSSAARLL
jgi:hypothetical protein